VDVEDVGYQGLDALDTGGLGVQRGDDVGLAQVVSVRRGLRLWSSSRTRRRLRSDTDEGGDL
jgi:hypothetical protein